MDDTLTFASLHQLATRLRQRELSPVELTEHFLQRIERYNPKLNAYIAVTADRALASARAAETALASGTDLGPLHGIPIAFKDLIDVAGLPTTGGSILRRNTLADANATVARMTPGSPAWNPHATLAEVMCLMNAESFPAGRPDEFSPTSPAPSKNTAHP